MEELARSCTLGDKAPGAKAEADAVRQARRKPRANIVKKRVTSQAKANFVKKKQNVYRFPENKLAYKD